MKSSTDVVAEAGRDISVTGVERKKMVRKLKAGGAAELMKYLVEDPIYLENFQARMRRGLLPPPIEAMVWAYASGRPKEEIRVQKTVAVRIVHEIRGETVEGEVATMPVLELTAADEAGADEQAG